MNLAGFQQKLTDRYNRLRHLRASENYPVYAIEHGFSPEEITTAMSLLGESYSAYNCISDAYWLVWAAAAAEVGYKYDGTEYWDTFRQTIPQWLDRTGDRNKIREFYQKFAATYQGLTPIGLWAKQFPIIAWPITQSILPKYLQRHFASHLFELRHELVKDRELTLEQIGDVLFSKYMGRSSLFEGFLQQKQLTSRIVMALSMEELADTVMPIEKQMLDRIIRDIDQLGSIGRRLRETRNILREARFINSYRSGFISLKKHDVSARAPLVERLDSPYLVARPDNNDIWTLSLSLPDLFSVLKNAGITTRDMDQAQMRFCPHSSQNSWIPARALFGYKRAVEEPLKTYPTKAIDIFIFDKPLEVAIAALKTHLHFPFKKVRLLKIRPDGSAHELYSRYIRARHSYVIVTDDILPEAFISGLGLTRLKSQITSAYLWHFEVPETLEKTKIAALASLDIGYRLGIHLKPVGLTPRWNSTDAVISFTNTEYPLFSISSEIDVDEYLVNLDQAAPLRIVPSKNGSTLINLGILSPGTHHLSVTALGVATGKNLAAETLSVEVRTATPWLTTIEEKSGVALKIEPPAATLDQLYIGAASFRVVAPPRRRLKFYVRFYELNGGLFSETELLKNYLTPVNDHKLTKELAQKLFSEAHIANVERAARIELTVSLEELGNSSIAFEKSVEPIRWLRIDDRKVRLSDDTGDAEPPHIERFDLEAVDIAIDVNYDKALDSVELSGKGGLLVATYKEHQYSVIVTATKWTHATLTDLNIPTRVSDTKPTVQQIVSALNKWHGARRLIGPLAPLLRSNAIKSLERELCVALCGDKWATSVERAKASVERAKLEMREIVGKLYQSIWKSPGFGSRLADFPWDEVGEGSILTEFIRLVNIYQLPANNAECELALKFAFNPYSINSLKLPADEILKKLISKQGLLRGAYFARMIADLRGSS